MTFEWHGWVDVVASPLADDDEAADARARTVLLAVQEYLDSQEPITNAVLQWRTHNGSMHVWMAGSHNHPGPGPLELFEHIGRLAPGSYGVLHSIDFDVDQNWSRRVLRRGEIHLEIEETLSPHVGAVEDPEPN